MILVRIDRYLSKTRSSPSRLGRDAVGDPNFVMNLRDGRQPRQATVERVIAFIERDECRSREAGPRARSAIGRLSRK